MKAFLLALLLLLPIRFAMAANAIDFFQWLHHRQTSNAVMIDSNTCLQTSGVWNPPANSHWLFLTWAEKPAATDHEESKEILYAANSSNPSSQNMEVSEVFFANGMADIEVFIEVNSVQYFYKTLTSLIPRNGLWHTVFVSIDTQAQAGDAFVVEAGTGNADFEAMQSFGGPVTIDWPAMNAYNVGCFINMPMAEFYADFGKFHWLLPQAAADFVSQQGYSLGLSTSAASHDCAEPTAATAIPQMCHTGNGNFFPNGPEAGPGIFAYQLSTVYGALTTAPDDPCLRRGIGDGCLVP